MGLGEDVVDEVDALRCGQEWTVLGVLVEMSHEGVKAGEGMPMRSTRWSMARGRCQGLLREISLD